MVMEVIRCSPIYMDCVWGREAWDISDQDGKQSFVIVDGVKMSLAALLKKSGRFIMGPRWSAHKLFPIKVKRLFCEMRLSLQVHPPQEVATNYGFQSKDEFWYVTKVLRNAQIFAGLKKNVTKEQFVKSLAEKSLEDCVHRFYSRRGDSLFVPSGRIHAIDGGNEILEIQENTDLTFRVYDWDRMGLNGKPRQLHVDQSLQSINFEDYEPHVANSNMDHMISVDCPKFRIQQFVKTLGDDPIIFEKEEQPRILHVVEGHVKVGGKSVSEGGNVILPYDGRFTIYAPEYAKFLITDNFFAN